MFHPGQRVRVLPVADNYDGYPPSGTKGFVIKRATDTDTVCQVLFGCEPYWICDDFLALVYCVPVFKRVKVVKDGKQVGILRIRWRYHRDNR